MKRVLPIFAVLMFFVATPAFAQGPSYSGFTVFANLGVGFQNDTFYEDTAVGLAGLNFGAGVFVTNRMAVLGRFSGTGVDFDGTSQGSGVWAGSIQYWLNNWASLEVGAGYGRWSDEFDLSDDGFGLIAAFHASVLQFGRHHVRAGVEYAPVFSNDPVHNIGVVVGYQYVR